MLLRALLLIIKIRRNNKKNSDKEIQRSLKDIESGIKQVLMNDKDEE